MKKKSWHAVSWVAFLFILLWGYSQMVDPKLYSTMARVPAWVAIVITAVCVVATLLSEKPKRQKLKKIKKGRVVVCPPELFHKAR